MRDYSETVFFLSRAVDVLTGHLTRPGCAACDEGLESAAVFCPACAPTTVSTCPPSVNDIQHVEACFAHGGAVATALNRLKHADRPDLARPLGHALRAHLREHPISADAIMPVPLHPVRLARRGYNQAALLARHVGRELALPVSYGRLRRIEPTPPQQGLGRAQRIANVAGAFAIHGRVEGVVLLVDDVCTTGSTLAACARALRSAGADEIRACVVAHAENEPVISSP